MWKILETKTQKRRGTKAKRAIDIFQREVVMNLMKFGYGHVEAILHFLAVLLFLHLLSLRKK